MAADSGATVVIPGGSMPWKCTVNGVTYTYAAGTEVAESSLPAGVLAEIKAYWAAQKAQEASGGSTGGGNTGGDSNGVITLMLTPTSDASTQSSDESVTKLSYNCNMTYAQAKAAFEAMRPMTALYLGYGGWHSANSVRLSQTYILMEFPEQLNVYWDETGFYTGEPSSYNPDAET